MKMDLLLDSKGILLYANRIKSRLRKERNQCRSGAAALPMSLQPWRFGAAALSMSVQPCIYIEFTKRN
jgi:hypothetical protein